MAIFPCGSAIQPAVSGEFYDHPINQSLRFNDDDSAYLSWTPASPGNRKTWTWSMWVKRSNLVNNGRLFSANASSGYNGIGLIFLNDTLYLLGDESTHAGDYVYQTTAVLRDPSAWYHIVLAVDTTDATAADRAKLYINGERNYWTVTSAFPQNFDTGVNSTSSHQLGNRAYYNDNYFDGYMAEVHFIDGQALDASYFGETVSGVWKPIEYTGTYGDNGFYLPFNHDYSVEGFSATTYTGNGSSSGQYIGGLGFEPDLLWVKNRTSAASHIVTDSVRGVNNVLVTSSTSAEQNLSSYITGYEADGFTVGTSATDLNASGNKYVAWAWDAGSGSPASDTNGTITSTVKANPTYGFSIVSYTGNGTNGATVGHGLSSSPEVVIFKNRSASAHWKFTTTVLGASDPYPNLTLNSTSATDTNNNLRGVSSSIITIGDNYQSNGSGNGIIAYCFHSVSGYSKIGSYTGTGASGNSVTTGFKPAFVMVKVTSTTENWVIFDNVRDTTGLNDKGLYPNTSDAEATITTNGITFTDTGFSVDGTGNRTNGSGQTYIYMAFADTREAAFWLDQSGNNNDFENNNLTESDISLDSPTNNFATWNTVQDDGGLTLSWSEGNLRFNAPSSGWGTTTATIAYPSTGKYYWEAYLIDDGELIVGMQDVSTRIGTSWTAINYGYYTSGLKFTSGTQSAYGASYTTGDIIGVAYDADTGTLTMYKNNVSQGALVTGASSEYVPTLITSSTYPVYSVSNFGQDSSFAGNKTAQGNTDDNGYGDFYYAPPTGYLALCTANLEVPEAMDPALDASPQDHFNTVLYTGTGDTLDRDVSGVGFQPDLVWQKRRSTGSAHFLYDAVRGAGSGKAICSNLTNAEGACADDAYGYIDDFLADGFSTYPGTVNNDIFNSTYSFVAWNWKANGSGVSNTDGSITSTVSANTDAGFSIVSYTGTGATSDQTVGHGLSSAPEMVIVKNRSSATDGNWRVSHVSLSANNNLVLNDTGAVFDVSTSGSGGLGTGSETSTTFTLKKGTVGTNNVNQSGVTYIAYCFHSVEGFSKFGSYTGNGSTDGSFIYCGFKPSFVIIKRTDSTSNWQLYDDERDAYNVSERPLAPNLSDAEGVAGTNKLDFVSNGFKLRQTGTATNGSGASYIYMAFAENPFKYANAR